MKIVDIAEFYAPTGGGVRTYIDEKIEAGARLGCEIVIIAPGEADRIEPRRGGRVIWVKSPLLPFDRNYRMFWDAAPVHAVLDVERPDVIEASSPWRGAWIAAGWSGPATRMLFMHADPVATYPHRWFGALFSPDRIDAMFEWYWRYTRRLTGFYSVVVVASEWLRARLEKQGVERVVRVGFGVDPDLFHPRARDETVRRDLLAQCGLGPDARLLVGVGRHHFEKRWDTVIGAVSRAQQHRPIGLALVGDGLARPHVERYARNARNIHLMGAVYDRERLVSIVASGDALIHGSGTETFGFVPAEALAAGTPIIVPNTGGAAELADPAFAELYNTADPIDGGRAVGRMLARERAPMSAAATAAAGRVGSQQRHFEHLFALYACKAGRIAGQAHNPIGMIPEQLNAA